MIDQPRIEMAIVPSTSRYQDLAQSIAEDLGIQLVPVDAATPADLAERVLLVDLTAALPAQSLGHRVVAISEDLELECFEVVPPGQVRERLPRALHNLVEMERLRARVE